MNGANRTFAPPRLETYTQSYIGYSRRFSKAWSFVMTFGTVSCVAANIRNFTNLRSIFTPIRSLHSSSLVPSSADDHRNQPAYHCIICFQEEDTMADIYHHLLHKHSLSVHDHHPSETHRTATGVKHHHLICAYHCTR